ncbi:hydrolase CocE/NonD family protein [Venturia nashicola]|uniref:Hydrolase CocE/NonD family protein n=1 Tax=Venturia nashicola TaxID=86259 RepID=A0A4Z1PM53_9PEZI|nr:hydrolase CocE/NonD family protein [Venturia nashicola]TLD36268.1 hydrolase CocE/NonD family protein [Venturia nashicola]
MASVTFFKRPEELRTRFDHYLKGTDNGNQKEPRNPGAKDTVDRLERDWPILGTKPQPCILCFKPLTDKALTAETKVTYDINSKLGGLQIPFKVLNTNVVPINKFLGDAKVQLGRDDLIKRLELTIALAKRGPDSARLRTCCASHL